MLRWTLILVVFVVACQPTRPTPFPATLPPNGSGPITAQNATAVPTANPMASRTPTLPPTATSTITPTFTATHTPSDTPTATITPTPEKADHYALRRPIARELVDWIDRTYPYGWTQYGGRPVHLGVDFWNPRFTSVLAAADGAVLYAGSDSTLQFGPQTDYYGNLVVIEHTIISPEGLPVYTLYGHLHSVLVETGQMVKQGERIGVIGDSGVAIGPHLHFEVRVGDAYDYRTTRNPDLWIQPYLQFGTLAGRMTDASGRLARGSVIQVRSEETTRYTFTYVGNTVNSDPIWKENFSLGDLPAGQYDVIVSDKSGRVHFQETITIHSGKTTWVDVRLSR